jgi:predicted O-methyltransferase YrrM
MAIDISKALLIDGWCSETELTWLAQKALLHERIVEVGSWMGRSTTVLAEHTPGKVWAVDTWMGSEELKHILADKPSDWLYESFIKNMGDRANVVPVRMPSLEASRALGDIKFDMVFIDAAHDYESVKQDIEAWSVLCRPGALLCGHDYNWPEVRKAVDECLPEVARKRALTRKYAAVDWFSNSSIWSVYLPD